MSLKNYIFSSVNTKGSQDSDKFATIRLKSRKAKKMTAINEENGAANATTASDVASPPLPAQTVVNANSPNGLPSKSDQGDNSKVKRLLKLWTYISVEPLMLCWLLPSCFLFIAVENLALEKVNK